jgi:hypothetical protein
VLAGLSFLNHFPLYWSCCWLSPVRFSVRVLRAKSWPSASVPEYGPVRAGPPREFFFLPTNQVTHRLFVCLCCSVFARADFCFPVLVGAASSSVSCLWFRRVRFFSRSRFSQIVGAAFGFESAGRPWQPRLAVLRLVFYYFYGLVFKRFKKINDYKNKKLRNS